MSVVGPEQVAFFRKEGYLVVEDLLDPDADIAPLLDDYAEIVDRVAHEWHAEGVLSSTHASLGFDERVITMTSESGRSLLGYLDLTPPPGAVVDETSELYRGAPMFHLLTHARLLDAIEGMIGTEISSAPINHIRMKLPRDGMPSDSQSRADHAFLGTTPWHQDNLGLLPVADESDIITAWMPLQNATLENGCMQVVPRTHEAELMFHCAPSGAESSVPRIPDALIPGGAVQLPMSPGSVLFMTKRTIHSSLPSERPDELRLSLDLRFQPTGTPTGRTGLPGFVVRSATRPDTVMRDASHWEQMWLDYRANPASPVSMVSRWNDEEFVDLCV